MFRPTGLTLRAAPPKERDHLLDGAATPPLPRSIQSCPAGQRQNTQETAPSKTKDLSAQFLERGLRLSLQFKFRDPDLARQFAANEENRLSRNSPPWRCRGGCAHQCSVGSTR